MNPKPLFISLLLSLLLSLYCCLAIADDRTVTQQPVLKTPQKLETTHRQSTALNTRTPDKSQQVGKSQRKVTPLGYCCKDGKTFPSAKTDCQKSCGIYFATEKKARLKCTGFCCKDGIVNKITEVNCKENRGVFFGTQEAAEKRCAQDRGFCCKNGVISKSTINKCKNTKGTFSSVERTAKEQCQGYCCIDGKITQLTKRQCLAKRGKFYSSKKLAATKCKKTTGYCNTNGKTLRLSKDDCKNKKGTYFISPTLAKTALIKLQRLLLTNNQSKKFGLDSSQQVVPQGTSRQTSSSLKNEIQGKLSTRHGKVTIRFTRSVTKMEVFAGQKKLATLRNGSTFDVTPYLSQATTKGLIFNYYGDDGRKSIKVVGPNEMQSLAGKKPENSRVISSQTQPGAGNVTFHQELEIPTSITATPGAVIPGIQSSQIPDVPPQTTPQLPKISLQDMHINVLEDCSYQWVGNVARYVFPTEGLQRFVAVVQGVQNGMWQDLDSTWQDESNTSNPFQLSYYPPPDVIKKPVVLGFDPTGITRTRVVVKQTVANGSAIEALCTHQYMPVPDVQISMVLTDTNGILQGHAILQNKGPIPVCIGKLHATKRIGSGWFSAATPYHLDSPLAPGVSTIVTLNLDDENADELKLEFFTKRTQATNSWQMLDRAPIPINENTVINVLAEDTLIEEIGAISFLDNITMNVSFDQTQALHSTIATIVNNNSVPVENLSTQLQFTDQDISQVLNPSFNGWGQPWYELLTWGIPFDLNAGESRENLINFARPYLSTAARVSLRYNNLIIKQNIYTLHPVGVTIEDLQVTRTSPQTVSWSARIQNTSSMAGIDGIRINVKRRHGDGSWIDVMLETISPKLDAGSSNIVGSMFYASLPGTIKVRIEPYATLQDRSYQTEVLAEENIGFP